MLPAFPGSPGANDTIFFGLVGSLSPVYYEIQDPGERIELRLGSGRKGRSAVQYVDDILADMGLNYRDRTIQAF